MVTDTSTTARFKASVPTLPVRDAMAAQNYYCDVLGFKPEFMVNDGNGVPHFCGVSRDSVRLYLTTVEGKVRHGECDLVVDNVDVIHAEFKAKGVRIKRDPRDAPWGRHFTMFDLDANFLTIGSSDEMFRDMIGRSTRPLGDLLFSRFHRVAETAQAFAIVGAGKLSTTISASI